MFDCMFDPAAAGNFHANYSHAFDVISGNDLQELFCIILFVQLRAPDQCYMAADEIVVEAAVGIGSAVSSDEQSCSVKIRGIHRNQFNLYRPLRQLTAA